jgi:Amt family ammonium transporter
MAQLNGIRPATDLFIPWGEDVEEPLLAPSGRYARTLRRFGRYAAFAVPGYAIVTGIATLRDRPRLPLDPDWRQWGLIMATGFLVLVSFTALAALLSGTLGRRYAIAGLLAGLAGTVVLLPTGSLTPQAPAAAKSIVRGDWARVVIADGLRGKTAVIVVLTGAGLMIAAWWLLAVAVVKSRVLARTDAAFMVIAAPLLYLGGFGLRMVPTLGALVLLAAGMGVACTAARLTPAHEEEEATAPRPDDTAVLGPPVSDRPDWAEIDDTSGHRGKHEAAQ